MCHVGFVTQAPHGKLSYARAGFRRHVRSLFLKCPRTASPCEFLTLVPIMKARWCKKFCSHELHLEGRNIYICSIIWNTFTLAAPPLSSSTEATMYTPTILALRGEPISIASISLIVIPIPVTNFVLTPIGVLATCFRLWRRKTTAYIWWDDIWAALTMIFGILCMTSFELFLQNQSKRFYFLTNRGHHHLF